MTKSLYKKRPFWQEVKMDIIIKDSNNKFRILSAIKYLLLYPEVQLLFSYRVQHRLIKLGFPGKLLAKILWLITTWFIPCHIFPKAKIEGGVNILHALGIVIGDNVVIKSGVRILHNVTLGSKFGEMPFIDEGANIYAGAVVIGNIIIGKNAQIGANAVVIKDVSADCLAVGIPAIIKRKNI